MKKEEQKAVNRIKSNSRYFFKYVKKFRNSNCSSPEILINSSDQILTDQKSIADCLQAQFESVFSSPNKELDPTRKIPPVTINEPLGEFTIKFTQSILLV